ncbi:MAG: hypothetical protein QM791_16885 [Ferruginibacter sp.]
MRHLVLMIISLIGLQLVHAQAPFIQAGEYKLVTEATVTHRTGYTCENVYVNTTEVSVPEEDILHTFTTKGGCPMEYECISPGNCIWTPLLNSSSCIDFRGLSLVKNYDCATTDGDYIEYSSSGTGTYVRMFRRFFSSADLPYGGTIVYRDSIYVLDPASVYQSSIRATVFQKGPASTDSYYEHFKDQTTFSFRPIPIQRHNFAFLLTQNNLDQSQIMIPQNDVQATDKYIVNVRVKQYPATEASMILPTEDKVRISQYTDLSYAPVWQYKDPLTGNWINVPAQFIHDSYFDYTGVQQESDNATVEISAKDLFGDDYADYLNETVLFRTTNTAGTVYSNVLAFTVRLSSPHILNIEPTNLSCNMSGDGALKINFDRPLISGEKLNILLEEKDRQVNYSALNLSELNTGNSYTLTGLSAGNYQVGLIGKYASGIITDLDVDHRDESVPVYIASNSINFKNGFNTGPTDNFTAYTDYTSYASATYTGAYNHLATQAITQPLPVSALIKVVDTVICKGAATGKIEVYASGGNGETTVVFNAPHYYKYSYRLENETAFSAWQDFQNTTIINYESPTSPGNYLKVVKETIQGLKAGNYEFRVRDNNDCFSRDVQGNERLYKFKIAEPAKAITIDELDVSPITSHNLNNAVIKLKITGGTQYPQTQEQQLVEEAYVVKLRDSATGTYLRLNIDYTDTTIDGVYSLTTTQLGEGTYELIVTDKNWNQSLSEAQNTGCYLVVKIEIVNPDPLAVTIRKNKQVSCTGDRDAELVAVATGGVQDAEHPYTFTWYRVAGESGDVLLPGTDQLITIEDSVITDLPPGTYKVKVVDRYNNQAAGVFVVTEPLPITIIADSVDASCYSSYDGTMRIVSVTGGTPYQDMENRLFNYDCEWSNGAVTPVADKVAGGEYVVVVRDSMGCTAKETQLVGSPDRVIASSVVQQITCFNATDGQVTVSAEGGTGGYTYLWNTDAITAVVSGLDTGTYWCKVFDEKECYDSISVRLENPLAYMPDIPAERKICTGQTIKLDGGIKGTSMPLTYSWQGPNGYASEDPVATITQPGTYTLSVANSSGCTLSDQVVVTAVNSSITTEFIVSTQAYKGDKTILVNLSVPGSQDKVEWILPPGNSNISVVNQGINSCELLFADTGRFAITMRVYYASGCIDEIVKYVNVIDKDGINNPGSGGDAFLKSYSVVYPNPNRGDFTVNLNFSQATKARIRLVNTLTNQVMDSREVVITTPNTEQPEEYHLTGSLSGGMYVLVIETPKANFVYLVMITP